MGVCVAIAFVFAQLMCISQAGVPQKCSAMPECKGLQGDCCPNAQKVQLDCCVLAGVRIAAEDAEKDAEAAKKKAADAEAAAKKAEKEADDKEAEAKKKAAQAEYVTSHIKEAKCKNNAGCSHLVGFCCPNLDGTRLECCGSSTILTM